jgi:hypothetical protein
MELDMAKKSETPDAEAKAEEATDDAAKDQAAEKPEAAETPAAPPQQQVQVQVDDSEVLCCYSNFCRVTGSPEELIIDFGLNPQPTGIPQNPIKVSQRIVVNFYTAKRLLAALQMSVQRHEQVFGVLETDVSKRVTPQQQQLQQQQQQPQQPQQQ